MMMIFSLSYPRMITSYSHSSVESTHIANLKQSFILPCSSGASQAFYNVYLSRRNKLNFACRENSTRTKKILGKEKKVIWLFAISTIDCRCCCRVEYNIVVFEHVFWLSRRERESKSRKRSTFSLSSMWYSEQLPTRRIEEAKKIRKAKHPRSVRRAREWNMLFFIRTRTKESERYLRNIMCSCLCLEQRICRHEIRSPSSSELRIVYKIVW